MWPCLNRQHFNYLWNFKDKWHFQCLIKFYKNFKYKYFFEKLFIVNLCLCFLWWWWWWCFIHFLCFLNPINLALHQQNFFLPCLYLQIFQYFLYNLHLITLWCLTLQHFNFLGWWWDFLQFQWALWSFPFHQHLFFNFFFIVIKNTLKIYFFLWPNLILQILQYFLYFLHLTLLPCLYLQHFNYFLKCLDLFFKLKKN